MTTKYKFEPVCQSSPKNMDEQYKDRLGPHRTKNWDGFRGKDPNGHMRWKLGVPKAGNLRREALAVMDLAITSIVFRVSYRRHPRDTEAVGREERDVGSGLPTLIWIGSAPGLPTYGLDFALFVFSIFFFFLNSAKIVATVLVRLCKQMSLCCAYT